MFVSIFIGVYGKILIRILIGVCRFFLQHVTTLSSAFEKKRERSDDLSLEILSDNPEKASGWLKPSFKNNRNIEMR